MEHIPALDPNLVVESIHALEPIPFWNWFQELLELELESHGIGPEVESIPGLESVPRLELIQ